MSYHRMRRLGAANDASSTGFFDDLIDAGRGVVDTGREEIEGSAGEIAEKIIRSSQFKVVLDAVEKKAEQGVKNVVGANAIGLVGIGISAGIIGGFFGHGKVGVGAGVLGLGASLGWLMVVNKPAKK